jgi:hypothetical protein
MGQNKIITLIIIILLFTIALSSPGSVAEETEGIPSLTQPPIIPNPDSKIDVFKRLDNEREEGYLKDREEIIDDNYYFTTKQGFDYIHLEGTPAEIGYNHGLLLWEKVERGMASYAFLTEMRYNLNWDACRVQGSTFWPNIPYEYQQEIDGIVAGCAEKNARNPDGDVIDRYDIVAYNSIWDIWWRSSYIRSFLPFGLANVDQIHHCSGFVATGEATSDGGFVISQSLWMPYHLPPSHGVFADIVPESGNRMLIELQAGMIWSGTEWYMNDKGLVVGETTLGDAPYQFTKVPAFVRIRQAVQYASSIDEFANIMITNTNGAYCGDYMICDAKTNEAGIGKLIMVTMARAITPGTQRYGMRWVRWKAGTIVVILGITALNRSMKNTKVELIVKLVKGLLVTTGTLLQKRNRNIIGHFVVMWRTQQDTHTVHWMEKQLTEQWC